jgi:mannose-6-phosphate isomerase-like protein (cupin superfamily)
VKPPKHLVLDDDVHRALKNKKSETGINVRDLGNGALRSVLQLPLLADALGEILVESGYLDEVEFDRIRRQAMNRLRVAVERLADIVRSTRRNTLTAGSWEIKEVWQDAGRDVQILHVWVRDGHLHPIALHTHHGTEILSVLTGGVLSTIETESQIVTAPGTQIIPAGAAHSVSPLDRNTKLVCVISPPEPTFMAGKQ